jgi:hypothetical protein
MPILASAAYHDTEPCDRQEFCPGWVLKNSASYSEPALREVVS